MPHVVHVHFKVCRWPIWIRHFAYGRACTIIKCNTLCFPGKGRQASWVLSEASGSLGFSSKHLSHFHSTASPRISGRTKRRRQPNRVAAPRGLYFCRGGRLHCATGVRTGATAAPAGSAPMMLLEGLLSGEGWARGRDPGRSWVMVWEDGRLLSSACRPAPLQASDEYEPLTLVAQPQLHAHMCN